MEKKHKHKGVDRKHLISRKHKNPKVQKFHNEALKKDKKDVKVVLPTKVVNKPIKTANVSVDADGFISINVDALSFKGVRLTFTRQEGRTKKEVALQIDKIPCRSGGHNRRKVKDIKK